MVASRKAAPRSCRPGQCLNLEFSMCLCACVCSAPVYTCACVRGCGVCTQALLCSVHVMCVGLCMCMPACVCVCVWCTLALMVSAPLTASHECSACLSFLYSCTAEALWAWTPLCDRPNTKLLRPSRRCPCQESHAFRPEAPKDPALQRPEQELLCHPDPPAGQQCHRVHTVSGKHGAGVPGGCGPEAGAAGGELQVVGTGRVGMS